MTEDHAAVLERFNQAFNRQDPAGMMAWMTPDCVFENTYPTPDGTRYVGWDAVNAFWHDFFRQSSGARLDFEEIVLFGDRAVQRWVYSWQSEDGGHGHIRGVDLIRFRQGKISEKLSYVKG